jgi:hypothetical protein
MAAFTFDGEEWGDYAAQPRSLLEDCIGSRGGIVAGLHKRHQTAFQSILAGLSKFAEAKGLQPTLSGPHGKHDLCLFADGALAELEDQLDLEFLIQGCLQVHQTACGRKLMQFAPELAPVGKTNEDQDGSAQLYAKRAALLIVQPGRRWSRCEQFWRLRHRGTSMTSGQIRYEVTKAGDVTCNWNTGLATSNS